MKTLQAKLPLTITGKLSFPLRNIVAIALHRGRNIKTQFWMSSKHIFFNCQRGSHGRRNLYAQCIAILVVIEQISGEGSVGRGHSEDPAADGRHDAGSRGAKFGRLVNFAISYLALSRLWIFAPSLLSAICPWVSENGEGCRFAENLGPVSRSPAKLPGQIKRKIHRNKRTTSLTTHLQLTTYNLQRTTPLFSVPNYCSICRIPSFPFWCLLALSLCRHHTSFLISQWNDSGCEWEWGFVSQ